MKIVHSFWSKPLAHRFDDLGFRDPKFFALMILYSVAKAREHYGNIHLVTDSEGAALFHRLKAPYSSVTTSLDAIRAIHPSLWSYGKLYSYGMQEEPFFHIDYDVFLMRRLPSRLETAAVVAQSCETNTSWDRYYIECAAQLRHIPWLPGWWRAHLLATLARPRIRLMMLNAGTVGGSNVAAIRHFARDVMKCVTAPINRPFWRSITASGYESSRWWSVIIEQYGLYAFCARSEIKVETVLRQGPTISETIREGMANGYWHLMGDRKTDPRWKTALFSRVQREHPYICDAIEGIYPKRLDWQSDRGGRDLEHDSEEACLQI